MNKTFIFKVKVYNSIIHNWIGDFSHWTYKWEETWLSKGLNVYIDMAYIYMLKSYLTNIRVSGFLKDTHGVSSTQPPCMLSVSFLHDWYSLVPQMVWFNRVMRGQAISFDWQSSGPQRVNGQMQCRHYLFQWNYNTGY